MCYTFRYDWTNDVGDYAHYDLVIVPLQLCAYKGAFGVNYDVNIKGTVEEAQEYESKMKKETDGYFFNNCDDDDDNNKQQDEDDEDTGHRSKSKSSRHHHQSISEMNNKDNHHLTNGDKMDISNGPIEENDNFAQKNAKMLQSHPIKVNLMFRYRHYQMVIAFTYYSKLGMFMCWPDALVVTNGFSTQQN